MKKKLRVGMVVNALRNNGMLWPGQITNVGPPTEVKFYFAITELVGTHYIYDFDPQEIRQQFKGKKPKNLTAALKAALSRIAPRRKTRSQSEQEEDVERGSMSNVKETGIKEEESLEQTSRQKVEIDKSAQLNLSALLREQCKGQNNSLVIDSVMKTDIGGLIKAAKEDSVLRLDHFDPLSRTQKTEQVNAKHCLVQLVELSLEIILETNCQKEIEEQYKRLEKILKLEFLSAQVLAYSHILAKCNEFLNNESKSGQHIHLRSLIQHFLDDSLKSLDHMLSDGLMFERMAQLAI